MPRRSPPPFDQAEWLLDKLLAHPGCGTFKQLFTLLEYDKSSGLLSFHLKPPPREPGFNTDVGNLQRWRHLQFDTLRLIDLEAIGFTRTSRFFVIGCFPGGYSTYLLHTWPNSVGVGITPPSEDGGVGSAIPLDLLPRLDIRVEDLTLYDYAPEILNTPTSAPQTALLPLPFEPHTFDLVVCAAYLPARADPRPWRLTRLEVARILLGLLAVGNGGRMVIELEHIESPLTARLVIAFGRIADIETLKCSPIQKKRGKFELLVSGVRIDTLEFRDLTYGLQKLLHIMTYGGKKGKGRDLTSGDKDLITPWKSVLSPNGVNRIAEKGEKIWKVQYKAIQKHLQSKGIEIDNDQTN
ncbi:Ribosomal RNA large subunit methyltransferase J [Ceratobasidium theobromae]|uniref:Ribosomal RNA large subunit methyltransferase J n=1 Tax=Ceratobasidium theobromae TaxID=1582974 RepID=A0A5N5QBD4_9AGAM|nr:Ribosomal RNA large subunit methyltransferase J [Ceratobasidium theobromae]